MRAPPHGAVEKLTFHRRRLAWIAQERGYAAGWVAHKYREKFGEWPPTRVVEPLEPDGVTRAWVRSRAIAYAKAKAMEQQRKVEAR